MIAKCKYCCTVFEAKRKTAIFCSDLHRTLFGKLTEEEKRLKEMAYAKLFIPATQPFLDKYGSPTEKAAEEATVTVGTGTTYSWTVPAGSTTNSNIKDPFQNYLDEFNKIIKGMPPIDKAKPALLNLKQAANNYNDLTFWQKDAIVARCNNYLSNDYGTQRTDNNQQRLEQFHKIRVGKLPGHFPPSSNGIK